MGFAAHSERGALQALTGLAAGVALLASSATAGAQNYPDRPVRIILTTAAASGIDYIVRAAQPALSSAQKPGASSRSPNCLRVMAGGRGK